MFSNLFAITGSFILGASAGAFVIYLKFKPQRFPQAPEANLDQGTKLDASAPRLRMKALVVSRDPEMFSLLSQLFREKHIQTLKCFDESAAIPLLRSEKFTAIALDVDHVSGCAEILSHLAGPNKRLPVFAVGSKSNLQQAASSLAISSSACLIERPLVPSEVRGLLDAAYGRMLRDEQSYFRLSLQLPVTIRRASGEVLQCTTMNVSQGGMAINSSSSFTIGEQISIAFAIPNTDIVVSADATVIWDDKHGKAGMTFQCASSSIQARYYEWLHGHFFTTVDRGAAPTTDEVGQAVYAR